MMAQPEAEDKSGPKLGDVSDFVSGQRKGGQDCDWGEDYRAAGRAALVQILERQMALRVDRHLEYSGDNILFLFIIRDADRR